MRLLLAALILLVAAGELGAQAPPPPSNPTVTLAATTSAGARFGVAWGPVAGATAYRWVAGNFGAASVPLQAGQVTAPPLSLTLPFHPSGAYTGFVCVQTLSAGGVSPNSCAPVPVPAAPPPPPPPGTTHHLDYTEPTTSVDGTMLGDLAAVRAHWRVDGGPETVVTFPASSPAGGAARTQPLTVPATTGTLGVVFTAVDVWGNESPRSAVYTKAIGPTARPLPAAGGALTITR